MNIVVNLNKDRGITSQDAVTAVRRLFKVRKAGHAGTLDPLATGVLLVCVNEATKVAAILSDMDKEYLVTARLGASTSTYDAEGTVTREADDVRTSEDDLRRVLDRFRGTIGQIPPMYSAIKKDGTPLYKLARKGIAVERQPRTVTIHSLEITNFESPFMTLRVSCSKGTYIRTLCHDIGNALSVGAYVTELTRTRIGRYRLAEAARLSELPQKAAALFSLDSALAHIQGITLLPEDFRRVRHGVPVDASFYCDSPAWLTRKRGSGRLVRMLSPEGRLFGIGTIREGQLKVERLLNL